MRRLPLFLLTFALLATGCDSGISVINWLAELEGQPGFEEVSGQLTATGQPHNTAMTIFIENAPPGTILPWRIRRGDCSPTAPVFGNPTAYPPLVIGSGGSDSRSMLVQEGLTSGTTYHVTVHLSEDDMGTIVACGRLAPR